MTSSNPLQGQDKGPLFMSIASLAGLSAGWMRVLSRAGAPGRDGESVEGFARGAERRLASLSAELMAGLYRPHRPRMATIPKASGGVRVLRVPSVRDRIVQTSATLALSAILEPTFEDSSFGYRPGRSVQAAARRILSHRAAGLTHVVEADVEDFFDTVPHDRLLDKLRVHVGDPDVIALVSQWLEIAAPEARGLAQGSPLSPLLANLYLDSVDEALHGADTALVRYADDFVILCRSRAQAEDALGRAISALSAHGLLLHPEKTRIVPFDEGFRFLGHSFGAHGALNESAPGAPALVTEGAAAPLPAAAASGTASPSGARVGHDPLLRRLYLHGAGIRLSVAGEAFRVESAGETLADVPPLHLERIEIGPDAEVNARALRHAFSYGIAVDFIDGQGASLGHADQPFGRRARRHLHQAAARLDAERWRNIATVLVLGKVHNQRALLQRLNRRRKSPVLAATAQSLGRSLRRILNARDVDEVRGHEGEAARLYWPAYGSCFGDLSFTKRTRGPGADPANIVLNILSGMLQRDLRALAERMDLHPTFGFLHVQEGGDFCIGADLAEEFRAPIAEALAAYLFANRFLSAEDFEKLPHEATPWRISPAAFRTVVRQYEAYLDREVRSQQTGRPSTWRALLEEQARSFARMISAQTESEAAGYAPYRMDY